tara:strand:+ start:119 stop:352 length:234 start_codon:yes stop_codon:yes gene_type:complete
MSDTIQGHIDDRNNPHGVTKEDVGLDKIENFPVASDEEAINGEPSNRYLTPAKLKLVFKGVLMRRGHMNADGEVILP